MSFVSTNFVLFAVVFFAIYFIAPGRLRQAILLVGSYVFCGFFSLNFLSVLLLSTTVNFAFLRAMHRMPERERLLMILGVLANLGLLGGFKYLNFLRTTYGAAMTYVGFDATYEALSILVPIGISFYTFQAISLLIDVHRRKVRQPRLLDLALLLAFWPKLIAGPIIRGSQLFPQLAETKRFRWTNLWLGLESIVYGLALKTMLADYLAPEVNKVYNSPLSYSATDNLIAAFLYTFQIYGDFAGYSLMAIGFARIAGYHVLPNFRRPNFATSFADFWRRWHLSLSSFLGDYVYRSMPYKGPREWVRSRNTFFTMLISGLWHGPAWTFVTWGGLHGIFLVLGRQLGRLTAPIFADRRWLQLAAWPAQVALIIALVAFTRIFFRAGSMPEAFTIIGHIADGPIRPGDMQNKIAVLVCLLMIVAVMAIEAVVEFGYWQRLKRVRPIRLAWPIVLLLVTIVFGEFEGGQFVYVRF